MPDPCKRLPFMSSLGRASDRWQPEVRYEHVVQNTAGRPKPEIMRSLSGLKISAQELGSAPLAT